jgi:hypothetical protein
VSNPRVQDELDELRELADRIYTQVENTGEVPDSSLFGDEIYWEVAYTHARVWPDDLAARMLSYWDSAGWLTENGLGGGPW